MLEGLPASGKSTYAKELVLGGGNWVRINRDLLRTMLHFDKWSGKKEGDTILASQEIALAMLKSHTNVIIDDTNLSSRHENMWREIAASVGASFEKKSFTTDWSECIARDRDRDKKVGHNVILAMAMQYDKIPELRKIIVCDIDGTVADCDHRRHHLDSTPKDWKGFFSEMNKDLPRIHVYDDVYDLSVHTGADIIFVSARPEDYREATEEWLRYYGMDHFHLLMRPSNDSRPDTEVKEEIYNKYLSHYEIVKVFDDRPSVIRMWESKGLDVVDCGDGVEF